MTKEPLTEGLYAIDTVQSLRQRYALPPPFTQGRLGLCEYTYSTIGMGEKQEFPLPGLEFVL